MAVEGDFVQLLLRTLSEKEIVDSYELSVVIGKDHQLIVGAIKSLQSMGDVRVVMFSLASQAQPNPERNLDDFCVLHVMLNCFSLASWTQPTVVWITLIIVFPSSLSLPPSPFLPLPSSLSLPLPPSPSLSLPLPPSPSLGD